MYPPSSTFDKIAVNYFFCRSPIRCDLISDPPIKSPHNHKVDRNFLIFQENLRKHVLSTKKHEGKTIYQCESCPSDNAYQTNFSKELRAHLLDAHPDVYPTSNIASRYIASIFEEPSDESTSYANESDNLE
ncbi:hypothetical protein QAD02_012333 [Eretmocerus hayati]|uniref:Uncharacterized protein n=1 Tax=Eretmocerus hayati TaxID=131215 RepID=A0ACC2P0F2_9HYME|nr:hypothetical protein QAD02_012333 [Eretmocerus hayati]